MIDKVKYPRTMHLPWSPGLQNDDRVVQSLDGLIGREVVVTEKMDGENTTMYNDYIHARSIDGRYHASRDWVKGFWASKISGQIDAGVRICGENMYARHSITYDNLESYFYGFGLWWDDKCVSYDHTQYVFESLGITPAEELWRGTFTEAAMHRIEDAMDFDQQEGYVVRWTDNFEMQHFPNVVAKFVRENHVQTDKHWMHSKIVKNGLIDDTLT
jgi:hypothetical protein